MNGVIRAVDDDYKDVKSGTSVERPQLPRTRHHVNRPTSGRQVGVTPGQSYCGSSHVAPRGCLTIHSPS